MISPLRVRIDPSLPADAWLRTALEAHLGQHEAAAAGAATAKRAGGSTDPYAPLSQTLPGCGKAEGPPGKFGDF